MCYNSTTLGECGSLHRKPSDYSEETIQEMCTPPIGCTHLIMHFPVKKGRGCCRHCNKDYTNMQCSKCDICPLLFRRQELYLGFSLPKKANHEKKKGNEEVAGKS